MYMHIHINNLNEKNTLIALLNIQFMNLNESTDFIIAPTHSNLLVYGSSFANINCFLCLLGG